MECDCQPHARGESCLRLKETDRPFASSLSLGTPLVPVARAGLIHGVWQEAIRATEGCMEQWIQFGIGISGAFIGVMAVLHDIQRCERCGGERCPTRECVGPRPNYSAARDITPSGHAELTRMMLEAWHGCDCKARGDSVAPNERTEDDDGYTDIGGEG